MPERLPAPDGGDGIAERYRVPAVMAAIDILDALARQGTAGATLAELVRLTGRSKSTLHNLLATLEGEGFVGREQGERRFRLGARLVELGAAAARQTSAVGLVSSRLAALAAEHELSFALSQCTSKRQCQVIDGFFPPRGLHVGITIGDRYGPFDGAFGKCLLAGLPPREATRLINRARLPAHTERAITDPRAMLAELEMVRRQGWAASRQELNENNAVAAAVYGPDGVPALLVAALGFVSQLPQEAIPSVGAALRDLALAATHETGGRLPDHLDQPPLEAE
jgi:IclR family transcriptional regulator, acetate operon repressor